MEGQDPERKPYEPPAITFEADLEVRAGSPWGIPEFVDPADTGVQK